MTTRTYTIYVQRDPPISGYGGFDEWTIGPLTSEQADVLLEKITRAVNTCARQFAVDGGGTGSN